MGSVWSVCIVPRRWRLPIVILGTAGHDSLAVLYPGFDGSSAGHGDKRLRRVAYGDIGQVVMRCLHSALDRLAQKSCHPDDPESLGYAEYQKLTTPVADRWFGALRGLQRFPTQAKCPGL
jgi:hypothetical protein